MLSHSCGGLLAMRASGQDKGEAQNLAAVVAHFDLLAVGELDRRNRATAGEFAAAQREPAARINVASENARIVKIRVYKSRGEFRSQNPDAGGRGIAGSFLDLRFEF